jgi:hypothetical protein
MFNENKRNCLYLRIIMNDDKIIRKFFDVILDVIVKIIVYIFVDAFAVESFVDDFADTFESVEINVESSKDVFEFGQIVVRVNRRNVSTEEISEKKSKFFFNNFPSI